MQRFVLLDGVFSGCRDCLVSMAFELCRERFFEDPIAFSAGVLSWI